MDDHDESENNNILIMPEHPTIQQFLSFIDKDSSGNIGVEMKRMDVQYIIYGFLAKNQQIIFEYRLFYQDTKNRQTHWANMEELEGIINHALEEEDERKSWSFGFGLWAHMWH